MNDLDYIRWIDAMEDDLVALKVKNMRSYDEINSKLTFVFNECQRIKSLIKGELKTK